MPQIKLYSSLPKDREQNLPDNSVYIGPVDYSKDLWDDVWSNPYIVGRDGPAEECFNKYVSMFENDDWFMKHIDELAGKDLIYFDRSDAKRARFLLKKANPNDEDIQNIKL